MKTCFRMSKPEAMEQKNLTVCANFMFFPKNGFKTITEKPGKIAEIPGTIAEIPGKAFASKCM